MARLVESALAAGHSLIGESYVQELVAKVEAIDAPVEWHFVGHLQSNNGVELQQVRRVEGVDVVVRDSDVTQYARCVTEVGKHLQRVVIQHDHLHVEQVREELRVRLRDCVV